ncbi:hypothetical protein [Leptolyngbya sp. 7M]|uniref:hypothetical protein n=1 Tax=Leptolyngbya sp. 7M TaxID=2812896 RepID=UPI001B8C541A|nr:hypothetical protein [Leptolyngbya sp. 7M]QYO66835.1 hypothetical protein JVX88_08535 [Leptolyngbya sp. 7M]
MKRESPLEILVAENEQVNPAILLAEEFMRRDIADLLGVEDIKRAEEILYIGRMEIETVERHLAAFRRLPATPSVNIPTGF